ncbi:MAG TPA: hypothetical protein PLQ97_05955 [Myxococcota bacterium]|nr:hypothetical protein [Myxococcota bacterium]HQK50207.1 hypothetical protein [Myxococcota bacterium]
MQQVVTHRARARESHDQSLPEPSFRTSRDCSMCGDRFCAMRHFQEATRPSQKGGQG